MKRLFRSLAGTMTLGCTVIAAFAACTSEGGAVPAPHVDATPKAIEQDDTDTIPCAPRRVLQRICQRCHTNPPQNGAPFPLVTRSNIVRVGPDGEIRELMIEQLEMGRMPLTPVTIDYDSREALLDWLHAGAPAELPHACELPDASDAKAPVDSGARARSAPAPDDQDPADAAAEDDTESH